MYLVHFDFNTVIIFGADVYDDQLEQVNKVLPNMQHFTIYKSFARAKFEKKSVASTFEQFSRAAAYCLSDMRVII